MPLVAVEGNSKLCSIANDSVPALGVNDENMLRRYVYMSFFSDHTYPFSFFYTLVVLERGYMCVSYVFCCDRSVEAGQVHVFDEISKDGSHSNNASAFLRISLACSQMRQQATEASRKLVRFLITTRDVVP